MLKDVMLASLSLISLSRPDIPSEEFGSELQSNFEFLSFFLLFYTSVLSCQRGAFLSLSLDILDSPAKSREMRGTWLIQTGIMTLSFSAAGNEMMSRYLTISQTALQLC